MIHIWCDKEADRDAIFQLLVMDAMDPKRLQNVTYKDDGPRIEFKQNEILTCHVCYEEKDQLIFARCCQIPIFCQDCGKNYDKCTICHKDLITKRILLKPAHSVISWLNQSYS